MLEEVEVAVSPRMGKDVRGSAEVAGEKTPTSRPIITCRVVTDDAATYLAADYGNRSR
jgi:hypothetical protein